MPFQKGHQLSKGLKNSGRKTKLEEVREAIANVKEEITQEALIKLANSKVYQHLNNATKFSEVREMGLPITLRGIVERKETTLILPIPILDDVYVQNDNGNKENQSNEEENQSSAGGNISEQDHLNPASTD